jgi:hypothetical protein
VTIGSPVKSRVDGKEVTLFKKGEKVEVVGDDGRYGVRVPYPGGRKVANMEVPAWVCDHQLVARYRYKED